MLNLSFSLHQPISFVSAGILEQQAGWIHGERVIDSFELILCLKGTLWITQAGETHAVGPGNTLLLLPGLPHAGARACEGELSFFWMHFLVRKYTTPEDNELHNRLWVLSEKNGAGSAHECLLPSYCPLPEDDKLQIFANQLLHVNGTFYYTRHMQDALTTTLLIQLVQNYMDYYRTLHETERGNRSFTEMLEWLRLNYDRHLLIADVTQRFNYNEDYFSRVFRKRTGVYFADYMNRLRINRAKTLLYQTNGTVKEIAYQVGFSDEKYFMKTFKRYEGISASQYRNAFYLTHKNIR